MKTHLYYTYILTNKNHSVLYVGITNNLKRRIMEHKTKVHKGFTARYNVDALIYYEIFTNIHAAIAREKQIKAGSRQKKIELIERDNKEWRELMV